MSHLNPLIELIKIIFIKYIPINTGLTVADVSWHIHALCGSKLLSALNINFTWRLETNT